MALSHELVNAGVDPAVAERLAEFSERLLDANKRVNLSGARNDEEMLGHLLDSLTLVPYVRGPLVDVGSGGGLPAIPIALAMGVEITLIESVGKKCAFLEETVRNLGLSGIVLSKRAEDVGRDPAFRAVFACGTARAVASATTVLELVLPLLASGGQAVLQRGAPEPGEREAVMDAGPMLGGGPADVVDLGRGKRLVIVSKVSVTPDRFPRRAGVPEKRPLCMYAGSR
ncbi:MAG: 16S rRNA (guanine(527)-N(7))-methyltransferase RsmG [Candidatus Eremiobacteraeota bacterium]|nr:16S rRNA (guanine(527)-N(7))-methyltransferase RsmG [Candidatus Eremiobacteraeota bacterium]